MNRRQKKAIKGINYKGKQDFEAQLWVPYYQDPEIYQAAGVQSHVKLINSQPYVTAPPMTGHISAIPNGQIPPSSDRTCTPDDFIRFKRQTPSRSVKFHYNRNTDAKSLPYLVANRQLNIQIMLPNADGQPQTDGQSLDYSRPSTL